MNVENSINKYTGIQLEEMGKVKLMNRTDRKYWFHQDMLPKILDELKDDYLVMEIDGQRNLPYASTYYDTLDDNMYYEHHRGKLNRFKIRRRQYECSGISFLEIKFKNNKGRTVKSRIPTDYQNPHFNSTEGEFIDSHSPFDIDQLQPSLINSFTRITLVNKNMRERCTIDQNLNYKSKGNHLLMDQLVIVEVKTEGYTDSPMIKTLSENRIKVSGFSKYCIGRSIVEPGLKSNNFKEIHRRIEKKINISLASKTFKTTSA